MHRALLQVLVTEQVNKRREGEEGAGRWITRESEACWRSHSEASQAGEAEPGRGNSQCLVGSRRPVDEHGGAGSVVGHTTGEGMEGWLVRWGLRGHCVVPGF